VRIPKFGPRPLPFRFFTPRKEAFLLTEKEVEEEPKHSTDVVTKRTVTDHANSRKFVFQPITRLKRNNT